MKKAPYMVLSLAIIAIAIAGVRLVKTDSELRGFAERAANDQLPSVTRTLNANGMEAAVNFCKEPVKKAFQGKSYWVSCGLAATFYDPATYHVAFPQGNRVIIPVAIYARAEHGLPLIHKGYRTKDISVFAFVYRSRDDRSEPIAKASLDIPN